MAGVRAAQGLPKCVPAEEKQDVASLHRCCVKKNGISMSDACMRDVREFQACLDEQHPAPPPQTCKSAGSDYTAHADLECFQHGIHDKQGYRHTARSAQECRKKCDDHHQCLSFVFKEASHHCALKGIDDLKECHTEKGACLYTKNSL